MNLDLFLLDGNSSHFKQMCKTARRELKKMLTLYSLPNQSLRQQRIIEQELEKQISTNMQLISNLKTSHFYYSQSLTSAKSQAKSNRQKNNLSRRVKRAYVSAEQLLISLYRANINLSVILNENFELMNIEKQKRKQLQENRFLQEFEKEI